MSTTRKKRPLEWIFGTPSSSLRTINEVNGVVTGGIFAGMFADLKQVMSSQSRTFFFFIGSAVLECIAAGYSVYELAKTSNPTIPRVARVAMNLVIASAVTAAVVTALAFGMTIAPYIFFAVSLFHSLRSAFNVFKHAVQFFNSPKGSEERAMHKAQIVPNLIGVVVSSMLASAIGTALAFGAAPAVALGVTIATSTVLAINVAYSLVQLVKHARDRYKANKAAKQAEKEAATNGKAPVHTLGDLAERQAITPNVKTASLYHIELGISGTAAEVTDQKFKQFEKAHHLDVIVAMEKSTEGRNKSQPLQKAYLSKLIGKKIDDLDKKIKAAGDKPTSLFFDQSPKREAKRTVLRALKSYIDDADNNTGLADVNVDDVKYTNISFNRLCEHLESDRYLSSAFNSYFTEVGAVQKLFLASAHYVSQHFLTPAA